MATENQHNPNQRNLTVGGPEWRMLVLTAGLELDEARKAELDRILLGPINWDLLFYHASFHGTTGLIYRHLRAMDGGAPVEPAIMERLRKTYLMTAALGMRQMSYFKTVAEALEESGVDVIALKGVVLAESVYGDLGLRPFADVDVLVREIDWPQITKVLKEYKYESGAEEYAKLPPKLTKYDTQAHIQYMLGGTCLELQFDLLTLGIAMRDIDGVWARARRSGPSGSNVLVLSPEDQLLHLTVHANRHGCMQLKWLVDIAETLRQSDDLDWELIKEIATRENILTSVYSTLTHIERLFGRRLVSPDIMAGLKPRGYQLALWNAVWPRKQLDGFTGRNEDSICFYFYKPFSGWNLINFAVMGRLADKLAYQTRWIVPSLSWMSETYQEQNRLALLKYYPIRLRESRSRKKTGQNMGN
ncbi:MAG: nucleotidyltransferase domain-containing protein [Thermoleophilia bacterium]